MNLREARFKRNITQFELRLKTGIHQSKISYFERGYIVPTSTEIKAIAKALNFRPEEIKWKANDEGLVQA